jgi:hypothetical protein
VVFSFGIFIHADKPLTSFTVEEYHAELVALAVSGDFKRVAASTQDALEAGINFGDRIPTIYSLLGVALYNMGRCDTDHILLHQLISRQA